MDQTQSARSVTPADTMVATNDEVNAQIRHDERCATQAVFYEAEAVSCRAAIARAPRAVIDRDDIGGRRIPPTFRMAGIGMGAMQRCWYCDRTKSQLGGRRLGRLKLFKCADCVAEKPSKP